MSAPDTRGRTGWWPPTTWDGARNFADLGGLALRDGGTTAYRRVWRSAAHEWITETGWQTARDAGLRTVIDLRNDFEAGRRLEHPQVTERATAGIKILRRPTEDPTDARFLDRYGPLLDHPASWRANAVAYPAKFAAIFRAMADAAGPFLVHCAGGRDRTGMICSMLLVLARAEPDAVVACYEDGFRRAAADLREGLAYDPGTHTWVERVEEPPSQRELEFALDSRRPALRTWLDRFDSVSYLRTAGLSEGELRTLRRLLR